MVLVVMQLVWDLWYFLSESCWHSGNFTSCYRLEMLNLYVICYNVMNFIGEIKSGCGEAICFFELYLQWRFFGVRWVFMIRFMCNITTRFLVWISFWPLIGLIILSICKHLEVSGWFLMYLVDGIPTFLSSEFSSHSSIWV